MASIKELKKRAYNMQIANPDITEMSDGYSSLRTLKEKARRISTTINPTMSGDEVSKWFEDAYKLSDSVYNHLSNGGRAEDSGYTSQITSFLLKETDIEHYLRSNQSMFDDYDSTIGEFDYLVNTLKGLRDGVLRSNIVAGMENQFTGIAETLDKYNTKLNSGELLSEDEIAEYTKATKDYITVGNKLFTKENGYTEAAINSFQRLHPKVAAGTARAANLSELTRKYDDTIPSLNEYQAKIDNGEYLTTDELNEYDKLVQNAITIGNNLYTERNGFQSDVIQQWDGNATALANGATNIRDFYSQFKDADTYKKWKEWNDAWGHYYSSADFEEYAAKGAAIKNPDYKNVSEWNGPFKRVVRPLENKVSFARDNYVTIMGDYEGGRYGIPEEYGGDLVFFSKEIEENEYELYNYLLAKEGKEKADAYLDYLMPILKSRHAKEVADFYTNIDIPVLEEIAQIVVGLGSGVNNFVQGAKQLFSSDRIEPNVTQLTNQYISESLDGYQSYLYGAANTIGYMAPSILAAYATGGASAPASGAVTLASGATTAAATKAAALAGGATMFVGAAGNAYGEGLDMGMTKLQARGYSTMVGAAEAGLQYAIGGIGQLGGLSSAKFLAKAELIKRVFPRVAAKVAISVGSEIIEEEAQLFLEPLFKTIITGEEYEGPNGEAMIETAITTALSTWALDGFGNVGKEARINRDYRNTGTTIMAADGGVKALQDLAMEKAGAIKDIDTKVSNNLTKQVEGVSGEVATGKGVIGKIKAWDKNRMNATKVGMLYEATQKAGNIANASANQADIAKSLQRKLQDHGFNAETANDLAGALVAQYNGQELTKAQEKLLKSAEKSDVVKKAVDAAVKNIMLNEKSTMGQRSQDIRDFVDDVKVGIAAKNYNTTKDVVKKVAAAQETGDAVSVSPTSYKVSKKGKTLDKKGNEIVIEGVESTENGKLILKTKDGTIDSGDVVYANDSDALVYEAVAKMGASPASAWAMIKSFNEADGVSALEFATSAPLAYLYGKLGHENGVFKNGKPRLNLNATQSATVYQMGRTDAAASVKATTQASTESTITEKNAGKEIIYEGFKYDEETANEVQRASIEAIDVINKMSSLEVHVFKSYKKNGKFYTVINGKERIAPNGYFKDGNKIYIDFNAGRDGRGAMLFTIAHEIGHYIADVNAADFKVISDFLFAHYGPDAPIYDALQKKKAVVRESYKRDGKAIPSEAQLEKEAQEELVCDMLSRMLADKYAYDKLMELKQENLNAFQKLGQAIKKVLDKLAELIGIYDTQVADYAMAASKENFGEEAFRQLQDLYIKAFVQADANYQAMQAKVSTDSIRGGADGAVAQSEVVTELIKPADGKILKSERTEFEALPKQMMSLSDGSGTILHSIEGLTPTKVKGISGKTINGYTGREVRAYAMGISGFTKAQINRVNKFMDTMSEFMQEAGVTYKFIGLQDVKDAKLHYTYNADGSIKSIVLSAMVKNGDYPVNFDLSSICKKRVAMSKLIDKLAKRGSLDNGTVKLTPANIFKINTALKNEGYETACLGCFVESKRYNSLEWAKKFCNKWNAAVKKVNPNATYFGYGDATFSEDSFTLEQAIKIDEAANKYITTTKVERMANALKQYKERERQGLPLVVRNYKGVEYHDLSKAAKKRLAESDTISDELKEKYMNCDTTTLNIADVEFLLENGILSGAALSNKQAVTEMVKSGEAYQHLLRPSDLLTDRGISKLEALPNFHGVLYGHYGSGTPKLMQSYTPYNSEIALLPSKKGDQSLAEYLYTIAGVRMQSFSDFQIQNIYDYLQMVADLAARKLPAHAYTKEISFAKLLGMTGIKVNLSVMFDIDPMVDKAHAGLTKLNKLVHRDEYAKVVLEDAQGKWVYNIGDYQTQRLFAEAYPDEAKRFLQSIGFGDAVKLQSSPGYSANCGIIGVGYSDLGIIAMLNDNRIRYIIPYHASSLPAEIKLATNIALGTDYTPYQNNMKIKEIVDRNGNKVNWTVKEAYKRLRNGQAVINELNEKIRTEGWMVSTTKAQTGHGTYGLYENLQETNDPRQTASNFMDWCIGNGTLPLFYQFASHENYYKLLYDFNVYDCVTEEYAPQQAVTNTYPTMVDGQVQPGNVTEGNFDAEYFKGTIDKQMAFMNEYSKHLDEDLETMADELESGTMFSERDNTPTFYSQMAKVVDGVKQEKLGASSIVSMLRGKGVKTEEIKWSGIEAWLEGKKSVTKAELQEFIAGSMLQIEEEVLDNKDRPYTEDQQKRLDEYEAKRDEVANRLTAEWKKITGNDITIRNAAGLESFVVNAIIDANLEQKKATFEGRLLAKLKSDLKKVIENNDDFGFDSGHDALRSIHRHRRDFIKNYEMSTNDKAIIVKYCNALNAYNELPNMISDADTDRLRAIAREADPWNRKIMEVKHEYNEEAAKHRPNWQEYSLKGGKNYREMLFRIPGSTYSNAAMYTHWKQRKGVLAHARVQDMDTTDGKMLFVEEIQSDWHNAGHKDGYREPGVEDKQTLAMKMEDYTEEFFSSPIADVVRDRIAPIGYEGAGVSMILNFLMDSQESMESTLNTLSRKGASFSESEKNEIAKYAREYEEMYHKWETAPGEMTAPDAPFKDNYHEYVLKRLLREAAEQGYDSIGWTPADTQMKRWNPQRKTNAQMGLTDAKNPDAVAFEEGYRIEYDQDIPKFLSKYGKKWGATVGKTTLDNGTEVWSMDVTDSMKESVLYEGQPLYSERVTDEETLEFLENQEHITVYRAMQVIDGKLYPPMNAYTYDRDGKKVLMPPSEIDVWEQSTERPDLIDPKTGKFKLDKGKVDTGKRGTAVPAAYNPYIHTSLSMLNDQFTSAYQRSNLVVVKGLVPKSELTSGYHAQYAKDSVGETEWHSGVVSSQLPTSRKVILSRWFKPVEILDNDTVAESIKDMLAGTDIEIPYNVVSPGLRRSLEKIGVPVGEGRGIKGLPKKDEVLYQERTEDSISNRSLLANAFEGVVKDDIERKKIQEYKDKIDQIDAQERKLDELNEQIKELSFGKGPRDTKKIRELRDEATKTANRISNLDKILLRLEASAPLQKVLAREKKKAYDRAVQKGRETLADYRESAARSQMRTKIKNFKKKMETRLLRPTDRQFVPIDLINAMVEVCSIIDTDTDLYKADGSINKAQEQREKTKEKLQNLKDEYEKLKTHSDPIYAGEFDDMVYAYLTELRDKFKGKSLSEMSLDEMAEMYEILRGIDETLADARKLIGWGDAESVYEAGDSIVAEQREITKDRKNGKRNAYQKFRDSGNNLSLSPVRNVERMSDYHKDSYLLKLFKKFEQGIRKRNKFVMDAYKSFEKLTSGKEYDDAMYKETGKQYEDVNGRKFRLSKMQMMQAILSWERETANHKNHIASGGFSFADLDMLRKGKLKDAISEEYSHRVPAAVEMVADFQELLKNDKWCQDYMAAARKFFNETAKDAINETSIALKHRIIAKEKSYIPFEVDKNFVVREISAEDNIQQTINSYGMLKETKDGAPQPLIITGLNNILDRHIDQVGNVYGLAVEVRNFNKVWNVRAIDETGSDPTVKTAIQRNWGVEGVKHIEQAVQDIQGHRIRERSALYDKVKSGYIGATFLLNLSVVTKQIGSLFSSTSMLRWRDPVSMIGNLAYTMANSKKISAEVDKYTATAWMRRQGMSDAELYTLMTQAKKPGLVRLMNKAPAVINPTKWITAMDHAVALSLWRYAKIDTAKRTGLEGEELLKATAKFYDEVIENTQSMTDVLHRPEIQKRGDIVSEAFAMFKTDLYQMAGQLKATTGRFMADKSGENAKALGRTLYSIAMGAVWGQLMTTLFALIRYKVKPYRDDEDEELTVESWLTRQGYGLTGDLMGYIFPVVGSEVVGFFENIKYGETDEIVDSVALTAINDLYDGMIAVGTAINEGEWPELTEMRKLTSKVLQVFGIPANNILRTWDAIELHAKDIANGEFLSFEAGIDRSPKHHIHRIIEAMDEGKTDVAQGLFEEALEELATKKAEGGEYGEDELKEAKSDIKTALGKKYKDGEVSKETATKVMSNILEMDEDDIYWTFDQWDYAKETGSSDDYAKYGEFFTAVETGKNLKTVIKQYTDKGVSTDTLVSQISSNYKPKYIEMSKSERASIKGYLRNAMVCCGKTEDEANAKLQNWDLLADYPEYRVLSDSQAKKYHESVKSSGVSVSVYNEYCQAKEGYSKKDDILRVINSMTISNAQKDALYLSEGYAKSNLNEAPWH